MFYYFFIFFEGGGGGEGGIHGEKKRSFTLVSCQKYELYKK